MDVDIKQKWVTPKMWELKSPVAYMLVICSNEGSISIVWSDGEIEQCLIGRENKGIGGAIKIINQLAAAGWRVVTHTSQGGDMWTLGKCSGGYEDEHGK